MFPKEKVLIYTFTYDNRYASVLAYSEQDARDELRKTTANHGYAKLERVDEPILPIVLYSQLLPF